MFSKDTFLHDSITEKQFDDEKIDKKRKKRLFLKFNQFPTNKQARLGKNE